MTVEELRKYLEPFMGEAVVLVKQLDQFYPATRFTYVHMEEGHPVIVIAGEPYEE